MVLEDLGSCKSWESESNHDCCSEEGSKFSSKAEVLAADRTWKLAFEAIISLLMPSQTLRGSSSCSLSFDSFLCLNGCSHFLCVHLFPSSCPEKSEVGFPILPQTFSWASSLEVGSLE